MIAEGKSWSGLLCALCLTGCANVGPPGDLPFHVREDWTVEAPEDIDPDWWRRFDDPALNTLLEDALAQNLPLARSATGAEIARAQAALAGADRLPQLSAAFNARRQQQPASTGAGGQGQAPSQVSATTESYSANLNINWEIDLWGRLGDQRAAARAEYLAARQNYRALEQSIAAQVTQTYFALAEQRAQAALSEETAEALAETARQITNRAEFGVAAPTDQLLAVANFESARAGLAQRRAGVEQATRQLEILVAEYPSGTIEASADLPELPPPPGAGLPVELLQRRPDILEAEYALRAAGYRLSAARKSFLPSISLTGSYGVVSNELESLLDGGFETWSIAGQVLQPIFQGGRLRANAEIADLRRRDAVLAYADTVLNALSEVETALAQEAHLRQRVASLAASAEAAEDAYRVAVNRYEAGIDPFLNVLESQRRALDSRSAYLSARRALLENRVSLHLALGGGFPVADGASEGTPS